MEGNIQKQKEVAIFISTDFSKNWKRQRRLLHQEAITVVNIYALNFGTFNFIR
jgi:hypothetical protein